MFEEKLRTSLVLEQSGVFRRAENVSTSFGNGIINVGADCENVSHSETFANVSDTSSGQNPSVTMISLSLEFDEGQLQGVWKWEFSSFGLAVVEDFKLSPACQMCSVQVWNCSENVATCRAASKHVLSPDCSYSSSAARYIDRIPSQKV